MAPEGTASTGAGSTTGAAAAARTGVPPKRDEVQAPSPRAEHITAAVSQRAFFIVVLSCGAILMDGILRGQGTIRNMNLGQHRSGFEIWDRGAQKKAHGAPFCEDVARTPQTARAIIIFFTSAMALAGFRPLGQVLAQFMIVWQR